mmetsp:Transcript_41453/g.128088  ORF Transcript_41453/g.128088 Transcript_41453/m.128088 type:complete len:354 (+) Transcript_41453:220-1281(+)
MKRRRPGRPRWKRTLALKCTGLLFARALPNLDIAVTAVVTGRGGRCSGRVSCLERVAAGQVQRRKLGRVLRCLVLDPVCDVEVRGELLPRQLVVVKRVARTKAVRSGQARDGGDFVRVDQSPRTRVQGVLCVLREADPRHDVDVVAPGVSELAPPPAHEDLLLVDVARGPHVPVPRVEEDGLEHVLRRLAAVRARRRLAVLVVRLDVAGGAGLCGAGGGGGLGELRAELGLVVAEIEGHLDLGLVLLVHVDEVLVAARRVVEVDVVVTVHVRAVRVRHRHVAEVLDRRQHALLPEAFVLHQAVGSFGVAGGDDAVEHVEVALLVEHGDAPAVGGRPGELDDAAAEVEVHVAVL